MGSYGSHRVLRNRTELGSHGAARGRTGPHGAARGRTGPHGAARGRTGPHGAARGRTGPHGAARGRTGCTVSHGAIPRCSTTSPERNDPRGPQDWRLIENVTEFKSRVILLWFKYNAAYNTNRIDDTENNRLFSFSRRNSHVETSASFCRSVYPCYLRL